MVVCTFVGVRWGPRPFFKTGGPNISSDQGGLSESLDFALKLLGFCNVVARFISFCPSQGNNVGPSGTFRVNQHDNLAVEASKRDQPLLRIAFTNVFASNCEVVPDDLTACEIQPVNSNVPEALPFVPGNHELIVVTICRESKRRSCEV